MLEVNQSLLLPAVGLAAWTYVMWAWMYATRIPAIQRSGMKLDGHIPRGEQMATLPAVVRWKADNYNHLFEQPTIFYPVVIIAALLPGSGVADVALAWAYVVLRVVHSVFQATVNRIEVRFALFFVSSLVLLALVVRTGMTLLQA
ncbi:MAG: MAPEG family protein [Myxococcales bacterium]|nr:MAPEG family protein [Myxococcales bacterium]